MVELMENLVVDEEKNEHDKAMEEVQMKTYKSTVGIANGSMLGNELQETYSQHIAMNSLIMS